MNPESHTHAVPIHNTAAAADQSHTGGTDTAKTRAGSSQHSDQVIQEDAGMDYLVNELSTGSPALLTLAVLCNGSHVPGSPFSGSGGLYIGDSLDAIDLSGLVTVGGKSSLTISLSEYGGSGTVKCAISGNVNVSAVISAF
jgi:hypothetical protein